MPHTFGRRAALAGLLWALLFAATAGAAQAIPARLALVKARTGVALMGPAGSKALAALRRATTPELWISPREAVAPSYGTRVFSESAAAVAILERLGQSSAVGLIVGADHDLATGAIDAARGGRTSAAKSELRRGNRQAASGHPLAALASYRRAWESAFAALTALVAAKATHVPSAVLAAAAEQALGSRKIGLAGPMIIHGLPPLTSRGKPQLFFAGSEACPFCGVERWGMIVALSQFGTFSNLHLMQSDTVERPADRTFTFFRSSYRSPYVAFVPVEVWSNVRKGFGFAHLQRLTKSERVLLGNFDPPQQTPFIDVANRFIKIQSTVRPRLIAKLTWRRIADSLTRPGATSTQAIAGTAEVLTAELCEVTNGQPKSVCSSPVVKQYQAALPLLNGHGGGCPIGQTGSSIIRRDRARGPRARAARCIV